ncbi:MAG TPA: hypothetical protein VGC77_01990 [Rhodopseudomonas sp.]|uniref:hypothetical protein n=1 Tax=Rhodopseudomonas sp. TaxID=1078 RepID=UPI002ED84849
MNDMIIDGLAVLGAIALVMWLIRGLRAARDQAPDASQDAAGAKPAEVLSSTFDDDIAVIAAAVYAMRGCHHIVHIERQIDHTWASEGRWMHQTSHQPN